MKLRNPLFRPLLLVASVILTTGSASAVTLGTWTATKPITNETTASPTLGDGSDGNAGAIMYASFPVITLTNVGDSLTLSGSFTLAGGIAGVNQSIRFGLFDNNGSTTAMNWRGYLGVTSPDANTIFERVNQTSGDFLTTNVAYTTALTGTTNVGNANAPASGAFTFSETITKTASGVSMSYSVTGPSGYSWSGSNTDTTPNFGVTPIEYDRVGIGFSGGYSADQAVFSNITVTETTSDYNTWGTPYGLATGSEGGDLDGDGLTNQQEYAFGLIPNSGASGNPITVQLDKNLGTFTYQRRKPSLTGLTSYKILTSTDLVTWTPDAAGQAATAIPTTDNESVVVTLTTPPTAEKFFVRVSAN